MQLRFLCPQHRLWLEEHAAVAALQARRGYNTAAALARDGREVEAFNHAGCALEAAEIALANTASPKADCIRHYARAGALLAGLLRSWGQTAHVSLLIHGCLARLEELMRETRDRDVLMEACSMLLGGNLQSASNPPATLPGANVDNTATHTIH